jgi:hypothetical protein
VGFDFYGGNYCKVDRLKKMYSTITKYDMLQIFHFYWDFTERRTVHYNICVYYKSDLVHIVFFNLEHGECSYVQFCTDIDHFV